MEQFHPKSPEDIRTELGNAMQIQLAIRNGEEVSDFIEKHAQEVRKMLDDHPELFDQFAVSPEEVLSQMEEAIYH